jgi:isopentenyl diphosphate isomerase/L-lactate dehydrogenase-like FMN-dependent dehydrogenase
LSVAAGVAVLLVRTQLFAQGVEAGDVADFRGLAVAGEDGAYRVLELLKAEFDLAMALCGARTVGEVERGLIG